MNDDAFSGSKIALLCDQCVLVYQRDDFDHIPFPGLWDLPGGGREGEETPIACALRELEEEFSLKINADRISWVRRYDGAETGGLATYFMAAPITTADIAAIRFGDEGQRWRLEPVDAFLSNDKAIPHLKARLREYLDAQAE